MRLSKIAQKIVSPLIYPRMIFEAACQKSVFVFNYHEISDCPSKFSLDCGLNVQPALFRKHLSWIKKYFYVISPDQLIQNEFDRPAALITFDDGFASTFQEGVPILRDMNLPGVAFMNMAPVGGQVFWGGLAVYLCKYNADFSQRLACKYPKIRENLFLHCTEDDVKEFVADRGCPEIYDEARSYYGRFATLEDLQQSSKSGLYLGNHLFNHFNAVNISLAELKNQYCANEKALRAYSNYVSFFSYPFGQPDCYNQQTDEIILSLGAERIFTAYALPNYCSETQKFHRISLSDLIVDESSFKYNCIFPSLINYYFRKSKYFYV